MKDSGIAVFHVSHRFHSPVTNSDGARLRDIVCDLDGYFYVEFRLEELDKASRPFRTECRNDSRASIIIFDNRSVPFKFERFHSICHTLKVPSKYPYYSTLQA
jgi:hypothetical protein